MELLNPSPGREKDTASSDGNPSSAAEETASNNGENGEILDSNRDDIRGEAGSNGEDMMEEHQKEQELQVELEDETDRGFAAYCFFEDMHRMGNFISLESIWEDYNQDKIDLITASFLANAGIDILRTQEIEITPWVLPGSHLCYGDLVLLTLSGYLFPEDVTHMLHILVHWESF